MWTRGKTRVGTVDAKASSSEDQSPRGRVTLDGEAASKTTRAEKKTLMGNNVNVKIQTRNTFSSSGIKFIALGDAR